MGLVDVEVIEYPAFRRDALLHTERLQRHGGEFDPDYGMTTLAQPGLQRDISVLRTLARENRQEIPEYGQWACLGTYASVEHGGVVRVGDRVEVGAPVG